MFQAIMKFPPDYPYSPPSVKFLTKMWHPNVYEVSFFLKRLESLSVDCCDRKREQINFLTQSIIQ